MDKEALKAVGLSEVMEVEPSRPAIEILSRPSSKWLLLGLGLLVLGLLGFLIKERFVVAMVNGRPVLRYELDRKLVSAFGKETLENLIIEKLIQGEARKQKVAVTEEEVDAEVAKISQSLGEGAKIEEILALQGMTLKDLREQLKIRLQLNRILEKEISIGDEEVEKFIKENSQTLTATSEAEKKAEARERIKEQKMSEKVQTWISELLKNAKVSRFLK
jgi:foldase protein PrsA